MRNGASSDLLFSIDESSKVIYCDLVKGGPRDIDSSETEPIQSSCQLHLPVSVRWESMPILILALCFSCPIFSYFFKRQTMTNDFLNPSFIKRSS